MNKDAVAKDSTEGRAALPLALWTSRSDGVRVLDGEEDVVPEVLDGEEDVVPEAALEIPDSI